MNEREIIKRKIKLKDQHIEIIKTQRKKYLLKWMLLTVKEFLEAQMTEKFDPILSRKLDCINYLLEN